MASTSEDLPPVIETEEKLCQALEYWKNYSFVPDYIKLKDAVDTILMDARLVEARHGYMPRWVVSVHHIPYIL